MHGHAPHSHTAAEEKSIVALSSVKAAVILTGLKIVVGILSGSLGIIAEAAHSAIDLVAAVVTLVAVRVSSRPADREHMYGHGKVENLSALFETVLLLGTCVWIVYEAIERLFVRSAHLQIGWPTFAVMGISIVVDISRSRALGAAAKKHDSQALEADALHFSTDVWSSSVVILGLICVTLSRSLGLPWLVNADAVAALAVAGVSIWVSIQLGKKSIADLLDAVPPGLRDRVMAAAAVSGVLEIKKLRLRRAGPETFVDVSLTVSRDADLESAHAIATEAERAVRGAVPGADVVVHVEPTRWAGESTLSTVTVLAARHSMKAHAVSRHEQTDGSTIEMHVEVDPAHSLRSAHDAVSRFEADLRAAIPAVTRVVSHIEPAADVTSNMPADSVQVAAIEAAVDAICADGEKCMRPHATEVRRAAGKLDVSFHCVMDGATPIGAAHDVAEELEATLRRRFSNLRRVVIHMEPSSENG
jgi:cation diffusion facilitator family transporter